MEKKPETTRRTTRAPISQARGRWFKLGDAPLQDHFENEAAADVGEQEGDEPGQGPAQGGAAPPAVEMAPGEERREDEPGEDREHGLVVELHRLAKEGFGEDDSREDGQRKEGESNEDHAE